MSSTLVKISFLAAFIAQACIQVAHATPPAATYSVTYLPANAPKTSESGQTGTNQVYIPYRKAPRAGVTRYRVILCTVS